MFWRQSGIRCATNATILVIAAFALTACGESPPQQVADCATSSVAVSQPVKRTVTEWDEFAGRFEAIEEIQVRARVGGFVTAVMFSDGALGTSKT